MCDGVRGVAVVVALAPTLAVMRWVFLRPVGIVGVLGLCVAAVTTASVASVEARDSAASGPKGLLLSLDAATGREEWRASTPGSFAVEDVSKSVVVGRGFPCTSGPFETVAYAAGDGSELWRGPAAKDFPSTRGGEFMRNGSSRSGIVVVQAGKELQGRQARTGKVRWRAPIQPYPSVSVTSDNVFLASGVGAVDQSAVQALNRRTGESQWTVPFGTGSQAFASASLNAVAVELIDHEAKAVRTQVLDSRDGTLRWKSDGVPAAITDSIVVLQRTSPGLLLGPLVGIVVRDTMTGRQLWERELAGYVVEPPIHGRLVGFNERSTRVFAARTGRVLWTREGAFAPLVVGEKLVILWSPPRTLIAVDARTGREQWQTTLPKGAAGTNSVTIGAGVVYVTVGCAPNAN